MLVLLKPCPFLVVKRLRKNIIHVKHGKMPKVFFYPLHLRRRKYMRDFKSSSSWSRNAIKNYRLSWWELHSVSLNHSTKKRGSRISRRLLLYQSVPYVVIIFTSPAAATVESHSSLHREVCEPHCRLWSNLPLDNSLCLRCYGSDNSPPR